MKSSFRYETLDLNRLSSAKCHAIARQVYDTVFSKLWLEIDFPTFYQLFFNTRAFQQRIHLIYNEKRKLIGYLIFRVLDLRCSKTSYRVVRLATNILPEYAGNNLVHRMVFRDSLQAFLRSILRGARFMMLFTANTPKTYCLLARRVRSIYPSPHLGIKPRLHQAILSACRQLSIPVTDSTRLTSHHPTSLSKDLKNQLSSTVREDDFYRFYLERCPDFDRGQSLITVLELSAWQGMLEIINQVRIFTSTIKWRRRRLAVANRG